jgi:hypothetical protein
MVVTIAAIHPRMLVVIPVVIAIVETLAWPRDDASGANRGDGEQQAADCNSCSVFHGVS